MEAIKSEKYDYAIWVEEEHLDELENLKNDFINGVYKFIEEKYNDEIGTQSRKENIQTHWLIKLSDGTERKTKDLNEIKKFRNIGTSYINGIKLRVSTLNCGDLNIDIGKDDDETVSYCIECNEENIYKYTNRIENLFLSLRSKYFYIYRYIPLIFIISITLYFIYLYDKYQEPLFGTSPEKIIGLLVIIFFSYLGSLIVVMFIGFFLVPFKKFFLPKIFFELKGRNKDAERIKWAYKILLGLLLFTVIPFAMRSLGFL